MPRPRDDRPWQNRTAHVDVQHPSDWDDEVPTNRGDDRRQAVPAYNRYRHATRSNATRYGPRRILRFSLVPWTVEVRFRRGRRRGQQGRYRSIQGLLLPSAPILL